MAQKKTIKKTERLDEVSWKDIFRMDYIDYIFKKLSPFFFVIFLIILLESVDCIDIVDTYEKSAVKYEGKDFYGLEIPEDVEVYFTQDLRSCRFGIFGFQSYQLLGTYRKNEKKVYSLSFLDVEETKSILRHEFAHHYYSHHMSDAEKDEIEFLYFKYCQDPDEFYAYIKQHEVEECHLN